jgi:hypothetical protein
LVGRLKLLARDLWLQAVAFASILYYYVALTSEVLSFLVLSIYSPETPFSVACLDYVICIQYLNCNPTSFVVK